MSKRDKNINQNSDPFLNTRLKEKIFNSFLQFHFLWEIIFPIKKSNKIKNKITIFDKFLYKLWFWPRNIEADVWSKDEFGGLKDPNHFTYLDEDLKFIVNKIIENTPNKNAKILDLGCNVGRALNLLCEKKYTNLYGVDISTKSHDLMSRIYPELYKILKFDRNLFQNYLSKCEDLFFDTSFTIGATIENVHPSYPLIKNICRITKKTIILDINDSGYSYPRFWEWEFNKHNFYVKELYRTTSTKFIFQRDL